MKTFTFNGKTSDELGLVIKNMPPVPRAERDITSLSISGKNGSLHIDNNSWKSKRYTIECICKDTTKADLLKSTLWGTHKLTLSTYSDREFIATIKNQIDFDNYLTYLQSFPLELELQPFGYDATETTTTIGKEYVTATGEDITLNNTGVAPLEIGLKGNTSQEGTPTPDTPQEVQVVTGDNTIKVVGKNLLDKTQIVSGNTNNWTVTQIENGITLARLRSYSTGQPTLDLNVKPNTKYTFSYTLSNANVGIAISIDNTNWQYGTTTGSNTVTTSSAGIIYLKFSANAETSGDLTYIQLEESTTPSTYTPYQSQEYEINLGTLELCKISTYQDYLYKSGENWYKHKEIGKVVLDGSNKDKWTTQDKELTNSWRYYTSSVIPNAVPNVGLSDKFISVNSSTINSTDKEAFCRINQDQVAVRLNKTRATTLNEFKDWVEANPFNVYYVLSTPTEEQITNAELIEQLEAILNAVSYEDQTNISQENDNMAFILDVSALKKGTDKAVINNSGNVEVAPIITVGSQGTLTVNGYSIETTEDNITIDCELMECYNGTIAKNNKVILSEFPVLSVGNNNVVAQTANNITIKHKRGWL